jgi:RimJ/RimL family protein N-acetyltransferase
MVAERDSRRKGVASEALKLMMLLAIDQFGTSRFTAKIVDDNLPSIKLFEKQGFVKAKDVACFSEVHYELSEAVAPDAWGLLKSSASSIKGRMHLRGAVRRRD